MSFWEVIGDAAEGNFSHAYERLKDWWNGAPSWIKTLIQKLGVDGQKISEDLLTIAAKDVLANGLTTAAFTAAAKDIYAKLATDAGLLLQDVFAALNAKVSELLGQQPADAPAAEPAPAA